MGVKSALLAGKLTASALVMGLAAGGGNPLAGASVEIDFINNVATLAGNTVSIASLVGCSRNLAAYYTNAAGTLSSVAVDTLRYGDRGALIEGSAENLALRSEDFTNASWSKSNLTVTGDATAAPTGGTTADRLVENSSSGNHRVTQSMGTKGAARYCLSAYVKADQRSAVELAISVGSNFVSTIFSLSGSGSRVKNDDGGSQIDRRRYGVEVLGSGWYRVWLACQTTASLSHSIIIGLSNGTTNNYTGNTANGLYVWGAQYEVVTDLDGPTSYVPTTSAAVTRPADVVTFSDLTWITGTADTIHVEYVQRQQAANATLWAVDATNNKVMAFERVGRPTLGALKSIDTGFPGRVTKLATRLEASNNACAVDNGTVATDVTATAPGTVTAVRLGTDLAGANPLNGHITKFVAFDEAKDNTTLQLLANQDPPVSRVNIGRLQQTQLERQTGMMFHWSMATFSPTGQGEQWAEGNESLADFAPTSDPTALDIANDWLDAAELVGAQYICPVSMHHDGFALWNSSVAPRCVADTTWGGLSSANGDFIKTLHDRAIARGFQVFPYFSIWNRKYESDNPSFSTSSGRWAYTQFVMDLLTEFQAKCPDIVGLWTDGWLWRTGYLTVSWQDIREHMRALWPNALLTENSHEFTYEHSDIITYEDGGSSPMPSDNTAYAEVNSTIYSNTGFSHWFYNINNQESPNLADGESNGASTLKSAATLDTARDTARTNGMAHFMINVGPHVDGFVGASEVGVLTTLGTG